MVIKMKKVIFMLLAASVLLAGCHKTADLIKPEETTETVAAVKPKTKKVEENDATETNERKTKSVISEQLKMTNEWTIMGDYHTKITKHAAKDKDDRVLLGTSAQQENGEMKWGDSQYWTLAVLTKDGAYNLFYQRIQGLLYFEVNEAYISGVPTEVITLYVFSGTDREIRNYVYDESEDAFFEDRVFSTSQYSTAGVNNRYSTIPEAKAP